MAAALIKGDVENVLVEIVALDSLGVQTTTQASMVEQGVRLQKAIARSFSPCAGENMVVFGDEVGKRRRNGASNL